MSEELVTIIYLAGIFPAFLMITVFQKYNNWLHDEPVARSFSAFFVSIFWPLPLTLATVFLPMHLIVNKGSDVIVRKMKGLK